MEKQAEILAYLKHGYYRDAPIPSFEFNNTDLLFWLIFYKGQYSECGWDCYLEDIVDRVDTADINRLFALDEHSKYLKMTLLGMCVGYRAHRKDEPPDSFIKELHDLLLKKGASEFNIAISRDNPNKRYHYRQLCRYRHFKC